MAQLFFYLNLPVAHMSREVCSHAALVVLDPALFVLEFVHVVCFSNLILKVRVSRSLHEDFRRVLAPQRKLLSPSASHLHRKETIVKRATSLLFSGAVMLGGFGDD